MKAVMDRISAATIGAVLPRAEAGACIPENGQECGCYWILVGCWGGSCYYVQIQFKYNCWGDCLSTGHSC
jgi:hypothetical protein